MSDDNNLRTYKARVAVKEDWTASQLARKAQVEKGVPVVANMHKGSGDAALIAWAKAKGLAVSIDRSTDWGNPFEIDADGTRDQVIEWYREYFNHKRSLHERLSELRGKVLICWCHPQPCHGDFLRGQANE